eukprot:COSAG05_NODE_371_length_10705_cov_99.051475_12_plen_45_part_00
MHGGRTSLGGAGFALLLPRPGRAVALQLPLLRRRQLRLLRVRRL